MTCGFTQLLHESVAVNSSHDVWTRPDCQVFVQSLLLGHSLASDHATGAEV